MVINVATRVQCGQMYVSTVATHVNSVACLSLSSNRLNCKDCCVRISRNEIVGESVLTISVYHTYATDKYGI